MLLALLGATAGQGVVWYTGQFYALFFLTITLKLFYIPAYVLIGVSLIIGTPFFIFFGWLSDRIGRLKIILAGCLIAAVTYSTVLFPALTHYVNPDLEAFQQKNAITVTADASTCRGAYLRHPRSPSSRTATGRRIFVTKLGLSFKTENVRRTRATRHRSSSARTTIDGFDAAKWNAAFLDAGYPNLQKDKDGKIVPKPADASKVNWVMAELILVIMVIFVTMVYGPIAAFLVEMFPTKIRYTSMSLPYHIGNGWFGGMLPLLATAVVAATGNIYCRPLVSYRRGAHDVRDRRDVPA